MYIYICTIFFKLYNYIYIYLLKIFKSPVPEKIAHKRGTTGARNGQFGDT